MRRTQSVTRRAAAGVAAALGSMVLVAPAAAAQTALPANCAPSGAQVVCTVGFTGAAQSWTAPASVTMATVDVYGARGGFDGTSNVGGSGGRATATVPVTPGATLQVTVGDAGGNGVLATSGAGGLRRR